MASHGKIYWSSRKMPLITKKFIIRDKLREDSDLEPFETVYDVPGVKELIKKNTIGQFNKVLEFIESNLDDPRIATQAVDMKREGRLLFIEDGPWGLSSKKYIDAGFGFKSQRSLGQGKDGWTTLSTRYLDTTNIQGTQKYIVKYFSTYAKNYLDHTRAVIHFISETIKDGKKCPKILDPWTIKANHMFRALSNNNEVYKDSSVDPQMLVNYTAEICRANSWMLKNWGICFWDFGFESGKNYMVDHKNRVKWVDYGGAGIVRLPSEGPTFGPVAELKFARNYGYELSPILHKENLVIAESKFLMLQLVLHLEFWYNKFSNTRTNAGYYSSMTQINMEMIDELEKYVIPHILTWDLTKDLYNNFKNQNWLDDLVWKQIGKFLDRYEGLGKK